MDDLDLQQEFSDSLVWISDSKEICGELFINDAGEYATCILHKHPPQTGHCDGVDWCEDYCDDPVADICKTAGLVDSHGLPTFEFFEHFEVA